MHRFLPAFLVLFRVQAGELPIHGFTEMTLDESKIGCFNPVVSATVDQSAAIGRWLFGQARFWRVPRRVKVLSMSGSPEPNRG
jgi:hypothetical protein